MNIDPDVYLGVEIPKERIKIPKYTSSNYYLKLSSRQDIGLALVEPVVDKVLAELKLRLMENLSSVIENTDYSVTSSKGIKSIIEDMFYTLDSTAL